MFASDAPEMGCLEFAFICMLNGFLGVDCYYYEQANNRDILEHIDVLICYDKENYTNAARHIEMLAHKQEEEDVFCKVIDGTKCWMIEVYAYILEQKYDNINQKKTFIEINNVIESAIQFFQTYDVSINSIWENSLKLKTGLLEFNILDLVYKSLYGNYILGDDKEKIDMLIKMEDFFIEIINFLYLNKKESIYDLFNDIYNVKYEELRRTLIL